MPDGLTPQFKKEFEQKRVNLQRDKFQRSIDKVKSEYPDVADVSVKPGNWLEEKLAGKKAWASASPWTGNVTYFPERMGNMSDPEAENVFAHELTHSRQTRAMSPMQRLIAVGRSMLGEEPYHERPRELEAFQAMKDRSRAQGYNLPDPYTGATDIQLPAEQPAMPPMSKRRQTMSMFTNDRPMR